MQEAQIGTSVHYLPLHMMSYWAKRYDLKPDDFPVAQDFFKRCVSLPLFQGMTDNEQAYVISTVTKLLS